MLHIKLKRILNAALWNQILPTDPQPHLTMGMNSIGQNSSFSENCHVAYQIKKKHECDYILENILPTDPPLRLLGWSQNSTLSEHGHVAYQIKDNEECCNMEANILPTDPPPP